MPDKDAQTNDAHTNEHEEPASSPDVQTTSQLPLAELEPGWRIFRRRSPLIVPVTLGVIFFVLVAALSLAGVARVPVYLVWPLLFVFGAIAILQGAALYYAPNDLIWVVAAGVGFLVFFAVAALSILGFTFGVMVIALFCAAIVYLLRRRMVSVMEGTVHVMVLFGRYNRTLMPGIHFRFPGERPIAIVRTSEVFYTTPRQRVLASFGAEIELAATISYRVIPEQAHRAVLLVDDWEKRLHSLLETTVQDVVNELTPDDFVTSATRAEAQVTASGSYPTRLDRINSRLFLKVQYQVAHWGVQVRWVKVHDIRIELPVHAGADVRAAPHGRAARPAGEARSAAPSSVVDATTNPRPREEAASAAAPPRSPADGGGAASASHGPDSLQALIEAYDAVRERRITDPTTIRGIADAFDRLAQNQPPDHQLSFDPWDVARNLRRHAAALEQRARDAGQDRQAADDTGITQAAGDRVEPDAAGASEPLAGDDADGSDVSAEPPDGTDAADDGS